MSVQKAYNSWASQYDTNENKTRDIEAIALRKTLSHYSFDCCLEIGCGTGKNTQWLVTRAKHITAVDLSEEMLAKAKEKISVTNVSFTQADINKEWNFVNDKYDLITFSLVLEHIENLDHIFSKSAKLLQTGGHVYVGELHPFKQYSGSKARFETEEGLQVVQCYNHNVSDFTNAATKYGFAISELQEFFDDDDRANIPRLLVIVFEKK